MQFYQITSQKWNKLDILTNINILKITKFFKVAATIGSHYLAKQYG